MMFAATPIKHPSEDQANDQDARVIASAPATASTLSRLMLTSAMATAEAAPVKLLAAHRPECSSPNISSEPATFSRW